MNRNYTISNATRIYGDSTEVLRLSRDGIWANPDIPADDAAKLVLAAIDSNVKVMVQKAVEAEREACAKVCEAQITGGDYHYLTTQGHWDHMAQASTNCAAAIRARNNA